MTELEVLEAEARTCTKCRLATTRTNVVFCDGLPTAEIMFVGEAPGFHEDQQGVPFVGNAGKLLNTLLSEAGLRREQAYVANVLKCRPPNNRDPQADEIEACSPYLWSQIEMIQPKVIATLGNFATRLLLGRTAGISRLRGQPYPFRGSQLIPTYHPSALLRGGRGTMMAEARADFRLIAATLEAAKAAEPDVPAEQLAMF